MENKQRRGQSKLFPALFTIQIDLQSFYVYKLTTQINYFKKI